ncbi:hypothetical protein HAX54_012375 [Datura stramonium]|uniref:Uncharacterized protein n=1 Tax=Datura stramonium TaxID=4076 RepID=A0ABS8TLF8_DATST|nr:hypothetical protein [Datura stramonium]
MLDRAYRRKEHDGWIKSFFWSVVVAGVFEILCFLTYWIKTRKSSHETKQGYLLLSTRFKKFTYAELKKASSNFSKEIGRGGGGDDDSMGLGVLVTWIREKMSEASETKSWIEEIVDPALNGKFDLEKMEILLKLALQCSEEDRDARPTMREVVDMMVHPENLELKK